MPETRTIGRSIDDVIEGERGGLFSIALTLSDLGTALYVAGEEFRYDTSPIAVEFTRRADELAEYLADLSLSNDGVLTDDRQCARCGGDGKTSDEDPCIECRGSGYVNAGEANG